MKSASANRIPSLDGLRAISILLVLIGHLHESGVLAGFPIFGVHIFFVISGYLITTLLQREHERDNRIDLAAFYRRRCFRILPAAYTYIVVIALVIPASRSGLLAAATYTVSWTINKTPLVFFHLWSLSIEEQFYLLWPLALVLGFRYRARIAWIAMLVAALYRLALAFAPLEFTELYVHFSFPGAMDSIAAGCLLAIYEPQIRTRLGWMSDSPGIVIALPATAWTLGNLWWNNSSSVGVRMLGCLWGAVPLLIALWMFLLVERRDWIFNNPVVSTLGVLSYSIYLWQQPFTVEHRYHIIPALLMLGGCATASYLLIERPMLRLGARIERRNQRRQPLSPKLATTGQD